MSDLQAQAFLFADWYGESLLAVSSSELEALISELTDPSAADATIHWGRNYLYRAQVEVGAEKLSVVVKQFRNQGAKRRLERGLRGSKAERSWWRALDFARAAIPTAEPLLWIESTDAEGPSFFVSRHLGEQIEARYVLRALRDGSLADKFPGLSAEAFVDALGQAVWRMHQAGLFHRDLSIGNILMPAGTTAPTADDLAIIDLNRARKRQQLGLLERNRDLCRLAIFDRRLQRRFVAAYWQGRINRRRWWAYRLMHHGFRAKLEAKRLLRAPFRGLAAALKPRRAHVHIPDAPDAASARDKIVWDHLSDQPHQHASKLDKLKVRLADAPSHAAHQLAFVRTAPRIWRRYRQLQSQLYDQPVPWGGVGLCLRPWPEAPDELLAAIDDLGVRHLLLRLHPWQSEHSDELALARELHGRGHDLTFALPQNRDLVRDPQLWRQRIEQLATLFTPFGKRFIVGQAINRSKWGIWRYSDFFRLAHEACNVLRTDPQVEILGPGVIDFELHATAAVVNSSDCPQLDGLASLLYVDRRGAPENPQIGFDTVGKVLLTRAIADTARRCGSKNWITEVNWPLWEGPHSPAGKTVSVDEQAQADFLARYYLLALTTGAVERVYWWQLIARGYGLIAPSDASAAEPSGLRRRPSFAALATLHRQLEGTIFTGLLPAAEGTWLLAFERPLGTARQDGSMARENERIVVGWTVHNEALAHLPNAPSEVISQAGERVAEATSAKVMLGQSVRFFRI